MKPLSVMLGEATGWEDNIKTASVDKHHVLESTYIADGFIRSSRQTSLDNQYYALRKPSVS